MPDPKLEITIDFRDGVGTVSHWVFAVPALRLSARYLDLASSHASSEPAYRLSSDFLTRFADLVEQAAQRVGPQNRAALDAEAAAVFFAALAHPLN